MSTGHAITASSRIALHRMRLTLIDGNRDPIGTCNPTSVARCVAENSDCPLVGGKGVKGKPDIFLRPELLLRGKRQQAMIVGTGAAKERGRSSGSTGASLGSLSATP